MFQSKKTTVFARRAARSRLILGSAVVVCFFAGAAGAQTLTPVAGPTWTSAPAGSLTSSTVDAVPGRGVNNAGVSVGYNSATISSHFSAPITWGRAARWSIDGSLNSNLSPLQTAADDTDNQHAFAINDAGVAVGGASAYDANGASTGTRAVRWDASGTLTELGTLGLGTGGGFSGSYTYAQAEAINRSGAATGYADAFVNGSSVGTRAVRWDAGSTTATRLDGIGAQFANGTDGQSVGYTMNDDGTVVGYSYLFQDGVLQGQRAVRWAANGTSATVLPSLDSFSKTNSQAVAINSSGVAIGSSDLHDSNGNSLGTRAVRWDAAGSATELIGGLGARSDGMISASAYAINNAGTIAGFATKYVNGVDGGFRPVRWDAGTSTAVELDNLGVSASGYTSDFAYAINNLGTIVGNLFVGGFGARHATLWLGNSVAVTDLNTLLKPASGWVLTTASAVSDTGVVSGTGTFDPDGAGPAAATTRLFSLLVPQAGTYGQGDANFDTQTNFADLVILAQHYGQANTALNVNVADFDLNGITNFGDLVALAQHYTGSVAGLSGLGSDGFRTDWALAQSLVPEPSMLGLMFATLLRPRRR